MTGNGVPIADLLPHLKQLRYQLGPSSTTDLFSHLRHAASLEQLPYCIGGACNALFELARLQNEIVERAAGTEKRGTTSILGEKERNSLGYSVDAFFDFARRAQNAVIPYLSMKLGRGIPFSLADVVKQIRQKTNFLPESYTSQIVEYWESYGRKLKSYRDLAQHFSIVSSEARVYHSDDGSPYLCFLLPNNPEEKSPGRLKFDDPEIFAFSLMREHFYALLDFCSKLTWSMIDTSEDRQIVYAFGVLGPSTFGPGGPKYYRPLSVEGLKAEVLLFLEKIRESNRSPI